MDIVWGALERMVCVWRVRGVACAGTRLALGVSIEFIAAYGGSTWRKGREQAFATRVSPVDISKSIFTYQTKER